MKLVSVLLEFIIYVVIFKSLAFGKISLADQLHLNQIVYEYFKFHGVRTMNLIECSANGSASFLDMRFLLLHFMEEHVPVRFWSGVNYLNESQQRSQNSFKSNYSVGRRPLNLKLESLAHKTGVVLNCFSSPCGLNVLSWSADSEHNYFTTNRFWLLITDDYHNLQELEENDIFLSPDSEVKVLLISKNLESFSLFDIYKVAADKILMVNEVVADFKSIAQLIKSLQKYRSAISHRENLEGITFNTGLVIAFPDMFTNIEDVSMRHIDTISKVNNRITLELANKLNMKFNTHQMDNYGWRQPNGSFDGLMGMFQRNELDFGQMAIFMRLDRIDLCDFVAETFRIRAGVMFRQPPLSAVANIFALPFEIDVWIGIFFLILFTIFVFGLELHYSPYAHNMNFWDGVVFVWGALCQQGFHLSFANRSGRMIIFTTFVATLFFFTSFSANIVALLQSPSEAIHTLHDLSQSPLEIGVQDTVYNKIYFNETTDPVTRQLYHKKIAPKGESVYMRPLVGMEKIRTGLFAYQVELQAGYQIISDTFSEPEKCGLKELEPFQLPMLGVPTRKNFPYKELFRRQLRWQREVGLMNREERKWFPQKPKCEGGVGGFVSIGITECRYALAMFGYGVVLAVIIFCCEFLSKISLNVLKILKRSNEWTFILRKINSFFLRMKFAVAALVFIIFGNALKSSISFAEMSRPDQLQINQILHEYFKFHGVRTMNLIKCSTNKKASLMDLKILTSHLLEQNVPVRFWSGFDYQRESPQTLLYANSKSLQHNVSSGRHPLNIKFESLAHKTGMVLDSFSSSCGLNFLSWSAASEHYYFTTNRFWLLITDDHNDLEKLNEHDIFLPPDSEIKVLLISKDLKTFSLFDIYKVAADKALIVNEVVGDFQNVSQLIASLQKYGSVISYRENLEGITFKTGLVIAYPDMFTNIEDLSLRHFDIFSKVNHRITLELANKLNMKFNTHQMDNYGWRKPNGSFDGLMGMFQRNELDFGQMAIFMRLDRIALCDFVAETFRIRAGVMFRQPPLSAVANIFAMPFESDVWLSICLLILFTIFVFAMELHFSPNGHDMNFWDGVAFVWGAICQQGFYQSFGNRSGRIIFFTTFVATLFLFTSFSANIVALLQSPSEAIHTLNDLNKSPLEIGVQDTIYNKIYFNESTDPVTRQLYHKKIAPKGENVYMTPLVGMEKIRTGLFAYQVELQTGYQIISDTFSEPEKCGLKELEPFQLPMVGIPTRKNFPYKELFRRQLRWQREVGLMKREERKWLPQKPKCEGGVGGFFSIGITECRYAFAMFGYGVFLAGIIFCCELTIKIFFKVVRKLKKNTSET
ncbi:ionotropic receptor 75d [Haematobia irritans]|uniref:ionotropic receptor 75d n=1 Tax=Haematobia irritans TaxID=7368 RepID=UPI003F4FAAC0